MHIIAVNTVAADGGDIILKVSCQLSEVRVLLQKYSDSFSERTTIASRIILERSYSYIRPITKLSFYKLR